jgi:radical SAM superfamily enzyme YgiQ (UPF0313 family)
MTVHLVNPSDLSFGLSVITPRWLYVLASATPREYADPVIVDETIDHFDPTTVAPGDVVGIGVHTLNALRGYKVGKMAREAGAKVIFGGVHASLYPEEAVELGGAHGVVKGDGDRAWADVLADCANGGPRPVYEGGRVEPEDFKPARWDLMPKDKYMWASVQTVRGCPKHCSFCSVWRTDGQRPRQRAADVVLEEIVELRRMGFRFIALADDNFYPVTLEDLEHAARREDKSRLRELEAIRQERFDLMARLAELPSDLVFMTQITMEAADDVEFLEAMRKANVKGALVGVESVTPEGLKSVYKDFNSSGEGLVRRLQRFREHKVYILGSFIFGLSTDRPDTFEYTADIAHRSGVVFAQFLPLTPLPGTVDFDRWEENVRSTGESIAGVPMSRYWLIPHSRRPKMYTPHPVMSAAEIIQRTQDVWDRFYRLPLVWERSTITKSIRGRLIFMLMSKLYRQMYAKSGFATDSARTRRAKRWTQWIAKPVRGLFQAPPMPELQVPRRASD